MINPLELMGNMPEKIEAGNMSVFEKREPIYNSTVFSIPVKYLLLGYIAYKIFKRR